MISFKGRHHQQNIILQCVRWYVAYSLSYRAVDKQGKTIDFLLTARRDKKAARGFLNKAIGSNGKPSLINIDKSGANTAGIKQYNSDENKRIKIGQCKYLNNIVEQDHHFIKRITRPMLGFKSFWSARATLAGIELWRMLKKGQNKSSLPAWEQFYALAAAGKVCLANSISSRKSKFATEPISDTPEIKFQAKGCSRISDSRKQGLYSFYTPGHISYLSSLCCRLPAGSK